jgi:hypothetical protein
LHPDRIAAIVNQKMAHSTLLAEELGEGDSTFNFLYQAGARYELYSVNIGRDYFVTLLFNVSEWRGRIGQVWLALQRAVRDLAKSLPPLDLAIADIKLMPQETKAPPRPPVQTKPEPEPTPPPIMLPEPEPEPMPEPIQLSEEEMVEFAGLFDGMETADAAVDFDAFWDSALDGSDDAGASRGELSLAEAQKMGLVSLPDIPTPPEPATPEVATTAVSEPEPIVEPDHIEASTGELKELFADLTGDGEAVDFDAFWDTALDEGDSGANLRGISFEDAVKQGLLSTDFREKE